MVSLVAPGKVVAAESGDTGGRALSPVGRDDDEVGYQLKDNVIRPPPMLCKFVSQRIRS